MAVKIIALTGGIGTGKSTVSQWLAQSGIALVDTDLLARLVVEPGSPALEDICSRFGKSVLDDRGRLRRSALADLVFADGNARRDLEAILHPRIRVAWRAEANSWERAGRDLGVVVIPLLFEIGAEKEFDQTVCVGCGERVQWERLRARGWSEAQIRQRLAAQWPIAEKMAHSDRVIWNDGDLRTLAEQARRIFGKWSEVGLG